MSNTPRSPFDDNSGSFDPPGSPPPPPPSSPPSSSPPSSSRPAPPPPPSSPPSSGPAGSQPPPPPGYVPYGTHQSGVAGQLAAPGRRIVARVIDGLITVAFFFVLAVFFGGGFIVTGVSASDAFGVQVIGLVLVIAYEAAFLTARGATPGKMIMSVKVVYEDQRPLDLNGALMRLSPNIVLGIVALVPALVRLTDLANLAIIVVSLVFLFTHERRQAVWDRIAKTIVVAT